MNLTGFRPLYTEDSSAVLTACLDVSRGTESGAEEVRLRWEALREQLDDIATPMLSAAEERLLGDTGVGSGWARTVVVGPEGRVLLEELTPVPAREFAHCGPFPRLLPLIAAQDALVGHVVIEVDRIGADITVVAPAGQWVETVSGKDEPVHKASAGGWSHMRWQHHVEEVWERNAAGVADRVEKLLAAVDVEVVAVVGDVRSANLLKDALPEALRERVHLLDGGGRGEHAPAGRLPDQLTSVLEDHSAQRARHTADRFGEAGGHGRTVRGLTDTVEALRRAQVHTLLLPQDWSPDRLASYGPDPTLIGLADGELTALGVPDPAHAAIEDLVIRAAVGTDAVAAVIPRHILDLHDEPAAILRFADMSTPTSDERDDE